MRRVQIFALVICLCLTSGEALAGSHNQLPVPALGDLGLVVLGLGLVGGGLASMRRRRS
jgi:hypothetical protein